ncbi:hypothetical protein [Moorena bouillonii]|uniref:hypothetical protein n=1 Tax=Moorena bouillonii TaxID=207920 RepID=UPI00117EABDC|nr:hypothetical protein [Moorena bouillonii]
MGFFLAIRYTGFFPCSRFPITDSRFPIPDSRFPIPFLYKLKKNSRRHTIYGYFNFLCHKISKPNLL